MESLLGKEGLDLLLKDSAKTLFGDSDLFEHQQKKVRIISTSAQVCSLKSAKGSRRHEDSPVEVNFMPSSSHPRRKRFYLVSVLVLALLADAVELLSVVSAVESPVEDAGLGQLLDGDRDRGDELVGLSAVGVEVVVEVSTHVNGLIEWKEESEEKCEE